MNEPICPFCNAKQKQKPIKSWSYGKIIQRHEDNGNMWGAAIKCSRYKCECDKIFNFYKSPNKSWTIPKPQKH